MGPMSERPMNIAGILLAAGTASRFGANKLIQPLEDGAAIAVHAVRNLVAAIPYVIAVVRWDDIPLYNLLSEEDCIVAKCRDAERGMGASLAYGVARTRDADGWVIALADMPRIAPATIRAVAAALAEGALIARPVYRGTDGHPVGFAAGLREELLALDGDVGARSVIERHAVELRRIECDDAGVLLDIDRREDLSGVLGAAR